MTLLVSCRTQPDDSVVRRKRTDPSVVVKTLGEAAIAEAKRRAIAAGLRHLVDALDPELPRWTCKSTAASPDAVRLGRSRSATSHARFPRQPR